MVNVTRLPAVTADNRDRVNRWASKKYPTRLTKPKQPEQPVPISPQTCNNCPTRNNQKQCLTCQHYRQWDKLNKLQPLPYEHVPQAILENISDMPNGEKIIEGLRAMPLNKSVPLLMQYVLHVAVSDIAKYHNISHQAVAKKNKLSVTILRNYMANHP